MSWPHVDATRAPVVPTATMRVVDEAAASRFHLSPGQLMETAGFQLARFCVGFAGGVADSPVSVVIGSGNNGGDALVAARHLQNRGLRVGILLAAGPPKGINADHLRTAQALGMPIGPLHRGSLVATSGMVIDGVLGTGVRLPLRPEIAAALALINESGASVVAVDLPSGLDADTGEGTDSCVRAAATLTLGLPKPALLTSGAVGRLYVADIGLPPALFGQDADAARRLFAQDTLVEIVGRPGRVDAADRPD